MDPCSLEARSMTSRSLKRSLDSTHDLNEDSFEALPTKRRRSRSLSLTHSASPAFSPPPSGYELDRLNHHIALSDFGTALQKAANAIFPGDQLSRYSRVDVILLSWEEEDPNLPVSIEICELGRVFRDCYGYHVEEWCIPGEDCHNRLQGKMLEWLGRGEESVLKIVYYAGHGKLTNHKQLAWTSRESRCPTVKWSGIQNTLEESRSDVLILLDCCSSGVCTSDEGNGVTELIAACAYNSSANGVGAYSFTHALNAKLKQMSQLPFFTVGHLYNAIFTEIQGWRIEEARHRKIPLHLVLSDNGVWARSIKLPNFSKAEGKVAAAPPATMKPAVPESLEVPPASESPHNSSGPGASNSPFSHQPSPSSSETSLSQLPEYPRLLFSIRLSEDVKAHELSTGLFADWLRSVPVSADLIRVEAGFASDSTLVLLSMPPSMVAYLPQNPAITLLGTTRSENVMTQASVDKVSVVEDTLSKLKKELAEVKLLLSQRAKGLQTAPTLPFSPELKHDLLGISDLGLSFDAGYGVSGRRESYEPKVPLNITDFAPRLSFHGSDSGVGTESNFERLDTGMEGLNMPEPGTLKRTSSEVSDRSRRIEYRPNPIQKTQTRTNDTHVVPTIEDIFFELEIHQYLQDFLDNGFDSIDIIKDMKESDFDSLGVKLGHRRKLQQWIASSGYFIDRSLVTPESASNGRRVQMYKRMNRGNENVASWSRYRRHPKLDEHAPDRPPSAYVIFSNTMREQFNHRNLSFAEMAKIVGGKWQDLLPPERDHYERQAFYAKESYMGELTEYMKTPKYRTYMQYLADIRAKDAKEQHQLQTLQTSFLPTPSGSTGSTTSDNHTRQDSNGVPWIAIEYFSDDIKMEYTIRCDIESINVDLLSPTFKANNCIYPRAWADDHFIANPVVYETESNAVGWALAELNPCLRGERGLIQKAVESWRSSNQDPRSGSKPVRRMTKINDSTLLAENNRRALSFNIAPLSPASPQLRYVASSPEAHQDEDDIASVYSLPIEEETQVVLAKMRPAHLSLDIPMFGGDIPEDIGYEMYKLSTLLQALDTKRAEIDSGGK